MSVLTAAPWRRAPLLLLRGNSAVLAALLFAGLILGAATAATPLFLSSVRDAALAEQLAQRCAAEYGFEVMTSGPLGAPSPSWSPPTTPKPSGTPTGSST